MNTPQPGSERLYPVKQSATRIVWHYWRWVPEQEIEAEAKACMKGFDSLPPLIRFALNEAPHGPTVAGARRMVRQLDDNAQSGDPGIYRC